MKKQVLFVCIHNSARSQMAEAFLNQICGDDFEAHSAGLEPGKLNPLAIEAMTGFVSSVEFADGSLWIPSRADLGSPQLQRVIAPSDEEQRLVQIYRKKGLQALVAELNKF